jgi:hypothetical protein
MKITEQMIDAGAQYLRETQQAGKRLTPWADTLKATKKKWLALSEGVLQAAGRAALERS